MPAIQTSPASPHALIHKCTSMLGVYADSYRTGIPKSISFPEYLFASYTTPLFKLERLILRLVRKCPG